ncbi:MAG: YciI family protein [Thermomicrobiales bacterium]
MPRFIVFVTLSGQGREDYEHGRMPDREEISRTMTYNQALAEAGVMQGGDGLHPHSRTIRVAFGDGGPVVSDGPFAESKEVIGGYWLWNVGSRREALEWAQKCPLNAGDGLELRQIFDPEDFGDAIGPAEQAQIDDVASKISSATM